MGKIHKLDDDLINKIAAGEVIERPANVVKELCENAIDAGAQNLIIDLKEAGTELISIKDDGEGMSKDDANLAVSRHATSKIKTKDDLFNIVSLGFRGEALASIAAVSQFSLSTFNSQEGIQLYTDESGAFQSKDYFGPQGTHIEVRELFYNVPARRKFLKSVPAENAVTNELVQALAIAHPHVGFKLSHNGKTLLHTKPITDTNESELTLRSKISAILESQTVDQLMYIEDESNLVKIKALVSPPGVEKATGKHIFTFVNNRWIKDKGLRHSIIRAYHSHLLKGRFPIVYLFIECDPGLIDVNVHPAKSEIKFQYQKETYDTIVKSIRNKIRGGDWAAPRSSHSADSYAPLSSMPTREISSGLSNRSLESFSKNFDIDSNSAMRASTPKATMRTLDFTRPNAARHNFEPETVAPSFSFNQETSKQGAAIPWADLDYIGCFQKCYLIFEHDAKMLVVDQHAFHERIQYEKLLKNPQILEERQKLLIPESMEVAPTESALISEHISFLREKGFEIEVINDHTVEFIAIPSLLSNRSLGDILKEILSNLESFNQGAINTKAMAHQLLSTIACHSAVRAGELLNDEDREKLIKEASGIDFYHNCPHGRRVFKWFSDYDVKNWFDRT